MTNPHTTELLRRYHAASDAQKTRGRAWYDAARDECHRISSDTGIACDRVAAVMAITSPDAKLVTNIRWTRAACEVKASGRNVLMPVGRYPRDQRPKVRAVLDQRRRNPAEFVTGPKVSAFYRAIMGDNDVLVIDRWAAHAAGEDRRTPPGAKLRRELETAYREAAAIAGESVRDFQAIVWIQAREATARSDGRIHRHFDF